MRFRTFFEYFILYLCYFFWKFWMDWVLYNQFIPLLTKWESFSPLEGYFSLEILHILNIFCIKQRPTRPKMLKNQWLFNRNVPYSIYNHKNFFYCDSLIRKLSATPFYQGAHKIWCIIILPFPFFLGFLTGSLYLFLCFLTNLLLQLLLRVFLMKVVPLSPQEGAV